jgi:hypothetical protein
MLVPFPQSCLVSSTLLFLRPLGGHGFVGYLDPESHRAVSVAHPTPGPRLDGKTIQSGLYRRGWRQSS